MKQRLLNCLAGIAMVAACFFGAVPTQGAPAMPAVVKSDFINPNPLYRSCHASTIVETPEGLVAAWFGGSREGAPDVSIWLARNTGNGWEPAEEVANGIDLKANIRYPCWNPVLFLRRNKQLLLFYKVGPSPEEWWAIVKMSPDYGKSWTRTKRLPSGFIGPVRNKPVELINGTLLCGSSTEDKGWRVHMEWTADPFGIWSRTPPLNSAFTVQAIQPTILQ
ncbi:MAG: exo-alpha-sialidase, partial [Verrucomicrobiae bacterium]|nr:exo-alpha-sialidase [Verrucomicrobiae bacterium]